MNLRSPDRWSERVHAFRHPEAIPEPHRRLGQQPIQTIGAERLPPILDHFGMN
jgi:hypothetical protein